MAGFFLTMPYAVLVDVAMVELKRNDTGDRMKGA